jgi:CDP-glucose 4,6-dehydratase
MQLGLFGNIFDGLTVLITGHTGFKGSWLSCWLTQMGARVVGFSLEEPPTKPSNFQVAAVHRHVIDVRGDIRDLRTLVDAIETHRPELVFHLAAQPIVLHGYQEPKLTLDVNAGGTVNVLEAIRITNKVRALVSITTDKVYRNQGWLWGYRESDALGDRDPYGASKAMAELAIHAYRESFFSKQTYDQHGVAIASARAGNVIGGGDFAAYRLVPDSMRALLAGKTIAVEVPGNVRPWQHVLEPLSGYLLLARKLLQEGPEYGEAWNFGPGDLGEVPAKLLVEKLITHWGSGEWVHTPTGRAEKETRFLRLSWEKAASRLGWRPVYSLDEALAEISDWFKAYKKNEDMYAVCQQHIAAYVQKARDKGLAWAI